MALPAIHKDIKLKDPQIRSVTFIVDMVFCMTLNDILITKRHPNTTMEFLLQRLYFNGEGLNFTINIWSRCKDNKFVDNGKL